MRRGINPDAILDALGDPTRRVIFVRLARKPATATELAQGLPVSRSAVARHLGVLRDAGMVTTAREGQSQRYSVTKEALVPLEAWISERNTQPQAPSSPRKRGPISQTLTK